MTDLAEQFAKIHAARKFAREDEEYLARRKDFAASLGVPELYKYIDQFGVYAGSLTLASRLLAYEVVKQTVHVPGHIVEFGVWHGSNLMFMAKVLRLLQPSTTKLVIGFDNFAGLPEAHKLDGSVAAASVGKYKGDEEVLRAAIACHGLGDWVHLVKGDANKTIPAFAQSFPEAVVSLAWVDFDLYEPCKTALDFLATRLAVGGIIVFDEAVIAAWPGETVAMLEFLEETGGHWRWEANTIGRQPTMYLVKER